MTGGNGRSKIPRSHVPIRRKARFTPTEKKILIVLGDGRLHSREELHDLLPDEIGAKEHNERDPYHNLKVHLSAIRRKLSTEAVIHCDRSNGVKYRYISLKLYPIDILAE